jgi:hypothetical protein
MKPAYKALLLAFALALLATSGFVCQRVAERGRFTGAYSSYGSGPLGTRALYLLAQELGGRPMHWAEDLAALPAGAGMLVALSDCKSGMARSLSRFEQQELERWIAQGGVLLVAGARHYLPKGLGVGFEPEPACTAGWRLMKAEGEDQDQPFPPNAFDPKKKATGSAGRVARDAGLDAGAADDEQPLTLGTRHRSRDELLWSSAIGEPLLGLEPLPMRHPGRLALEPGAQHVVILSLPEPNDADQFQGPRTAGVVVRHGKGHVIVLASGSMLQNRALALADGGAMFARLLRAYASRGPVLFDEYHLGVGEKRSLMRYLRHAGAVPFIAQLSLVALLFLWRGGARFGGLRVPLEVPPAGTLSFVAALGGLFARADDPRGAMRILEKQALARVAAHHRLPASAPGNLARALAERGLREAAEAVRAIGQSERWLAEGLSLATASRKLDDAVALACA